MCEGWCENVSVSECASVSGYVIQYTNLSECVSVSECVIVSMNVSECLSGWMNVRVCEIECVYVWVNDFLLMPTFVCKKGIW